MTGKSIRITIASAVAAVAWYLPVAAALAAGDEIESGKTMDGSTVKTTSSFFPHALVERVRANIKRDPWARKAADEIVAAAKPWMEMSDDQLWGLMVGPAIDRSWVVWDNGHCPACKKSVPMYQWKIDALAVPWKVACPHCSERFPKNDFAAYHRSGLNAQGWFDPAKADRTLLFNAEHPDPKDPLHLFGVDDGSGYSEGEKPWRFIGAYLVYGQWKKLVCGSQSPTGPGGIKALAASYVVTGDPIAARKAAILLDRVADIYPEFNFLKQGWGYNNARHGNGYVSTWHDACEETREMALAYDQIFEAIRNDSQLVAFLRKKAVTQGLANPKASFADIQRNIEDRILRDALANTTPGNTKAKMHSNYPRKEVAVAVIETVLGWPGNRPRVMEYMDEIVANATVVDGVTGEKGLPSYASSVIGTLAEVLGLFDRMDPTVFPDLLKRHPSLRQTWRFFIDTWCLNAYYPNVGDALGFAQQAGDCRGIRFAPNSGYSDKFTASVEPSAFPFFWRLYELSGEVAYLQALVQANGGMVDNLPRDVFAHDPAAIRASISERIREHGMEVEAGSVNKAQWHLSIQRSGSGTHARALWLDYDSGGKHAHLDGMNLGLYARGLDLLPDFGYPAVQFGGWETPRALWYTKTAAHNTVVVEGRNQTAERFGRLVPGVSTLWADGKLLHAVRADGAGMYPADPKTGFEGCRRYERTAALVDLPEPEAFYVLDIFRVAGGQDHAKFVSSHFGTVGLEGLKPGAVEEYGHDTQTRGFRCDPNPAAGWSATWTIEDRYGYLPRGTDVRFRYTDLTWGAEAGLGESWVAPGGMERAEETWIPRLMIRRRSPQGGLESTFVAVMEPFGGTRAIQAIRRLPLRRPDGSEATDSAVAVEVTHIEGGRDLIVAADTAAPGPLVQKDWEVVLDGDLCLVRLGKDGKPVHVSLANGVSVSVGDLKVKNDAQQPLREWFRP